MDALDNIDLDDMFADDGDALFDGLDIDLDMDDIAGSSDLSRSALSSGPATSRPSAPPATAVAAASALHSTRSILGEEEHSVGSSRTRRKTKRKAKTPAFFEDADDEPYTNHHHTPAPKKRKTSKTSAASAKKKTAKSSTAATTASMESAAASALSAKPPPHAALANKAKSAKLAVAMPPPPPSSQPLARGQSTPGSYVVAAAGQFGGRQKRGGSSFALPKSTLNHTSTGAAAATVAAMNKNKLPFARATSDLSGSKASLNHGRSTASSLSALSSSAAAAAAESSSSSGHPFRPSLPQNTFCGISPSNALFYPFMQALPSDLTIKSRKVYPAICGSSANAAATTTATHGCTAAAQANGPHLSTAARSL
jgi:hypothetical protein